MIGTLDRTAEVRVRSARNWSLVRQYGIVAALAILVLCGQLLYSGFLAPANIRDILNQNAAVGIVAVGMTIVMVAGGFDLSVGAVYALSATLFAGTALDGPVGLAAAVCLAAGAACGLVNGLAVTALKVNPFIATLGTSSIISGLAYIYSDSKAFVVDKPSFGVLGNTLALGIPLPVLILVAAMLVGTVVLRFTVYGRNIYAVGGNREAARLSGVRVGVVTVLAYVATSLLAGLAGMIDASRLGVGQANVGASLSLDVIAVVVIGGTSLLGGEGAIWRSAVGLLTLATLTNLFYSLNVSQNWQLLAKGMIIVLAVALDAALRSRNR